MPRFLRVSLFLVTQAILCLAVLEIGLRVASRFSPDLASLLYLPEVRTDLEEFDTTEELMEGNPMGFVPGAVRGGFVLNSRGFRTEEYTGRRDPDGFRLLALGDSFTFSSGGVPWRYGWPEVLEDLLDRESRRSVEVFALGVPGVGPRFEKRLWELEGRRLRPDLVVLAFFVGDDFLEEPGIDSKISGVPPLLRVCTTCRLARNLWRIEQERQRVGGWPELETEAPEDRPPGTEIEAYLSKYDPLRPTFSEKSYLLLEWERSRICRPAHREEFDRMFRATTAVIRDLHHSVRRQRARFLVLIIPDEYQIDPDLRRRMMEAHGSSHGQLSVGLPQRRLREFLEREEIPYLDLLPVLRRAGLSERQYRLQDTHWNIEGNRTAARALASDLLTRGWLQR